MRSYRLIAFLGLSFISGVFEIGVVFRGITHDASPLFAFSLALAYQLGTLIPYPIGINRRANLALSIIVLIAFFILEFCNKTTTWWILPLVTMTSAVINVGRITLGKSEISTTVKRCARVVGFLCSPLMAQDFAFGFAILSTTALAGLAAILSAPAQFKSPDSLVSGRRTFMTATLFFHQVHYFSYYTVILVLLSRAHPPLLTVVLFVGGWVTYIASPHLVGQRFEPEKVALLGHIILPFILCGLGLSEANSPVWYSLWFLTGPFGGTIVSLTRYAKRSHGFDEIALASVENIGHCSGSLIAVVLIALALEPSFLFFVAAAFAALTAIALFMSLPRYRISPRGAAR